MAKIIIPQKKTATLEIIYNGEEISIQFPVDSMAGYRQTTEVIKEYRKLAEKQKTLTDNDKLSEDETAAILDQSIGLMESFRDAVRVAIRDEAYSKHLKTVEDDIPFTAWVAILGEIIAKYADYFGKVTSMEGEL